MIYDDLTFQNKFRHFNGIISSGTIRVMVYDCDVDPEFAHCDNFMNWVVETLNKEIDRLREDSDEG